MKKLFTLSLSLLALATLFVMSACSSSATSKPSSSSAKTTVTIATDGSTAPFTFNKNGQLTGYDIEVAKAVFAKLPQYTPNFRMVEFASIVTGIDSGRFQAGANNFGWSADRAQKYTFSLPLAKSNNAIAVKSGDYKTLADLAGKSTVGNPASNYSQAIRDYNTAHPDKPINLSYASGDTVATRLNQVESGKIDFVLYDTISLQQTIKEQGYSDLKVLPIQMPSTDPHEGFDYILFGKDDEGKKLASDFNSVLKQLYQNGTLKKISERYLGGDFTAPAGVYK